MSGMVGVSSIGTIAQILGEESLSLQSQLYAQQLQPFTNSLGSLLGQQNVYGQMGFQQAPETDEQREARRKSHIGYALGRARSWREDGDKIMDRIAFWQEFGLLARPLLKSLSKRLDHVTDNMEEWLKSAGIPEACHE